MSVQGTEKQYNDSLSGIPFVSMLQDSGHAQRYKQDQTDFLRTNLLLEHLLDEYCQSEQVL